MSKYNDIIMDWDMGSEIRCIYFIINYLTPEEQKRLFKIYGEGGSITLFWKKEIPRRFCFLEGESINVEEQNGYVDSWIVCNEILHGLKPTRYISRQKRYEVLKRQKWCCNICGVSLKFSKKSGWDGKIAHIDHIHPFSKWDSYVGDINESSNLQGLCSDCNMKKSKKTIN